MGNLMVIAVLTISLIAGAFLGIAFFKLFTKRELRKQQKNALEVLEGKRKNEIVLEGKVYDATKFRLRDDSGKEKLIDLKGGGKVEDACKEKDKTKIKKRKKSRIDIRRIKEDKKSSGKKKPASRRGSAKRRRRFG